MRPRTVRIHSENNEFQHAEVLRRNREKRQKHREFFVEGVKAIDLCRAKGWQISRWIYSHEVKLSSWAKNVLETSTAEQHLELPRELMAKLSDKNDTSELIALVRMPGDELDRIRLGSPALVLVLDRPSSPGNLGTIIRTADAMRADGIVLTGHAVDLYDPKTIRASVGTLFSLPIVRAESSRQIEPWMLQLKSECGVRIVGTSARAARTISEHDFRCSTVVLLGNETAGLSAHYRSLCDELVTIPIHGAASSLNVACAAAMALYEVDRQRRGQ